MRKLDPEEEDDPFNSYEVPPEAKLESFPSTGPHRLSSDLATFVESGRRGHGRCWGHVWAGARGWPRAARLCPT